MSKMCCGLIILFIIVIFGAANARINWPENERLKETSQYNYDYEQGFSGIYRNCNGNNNCNPKSHYYNNGINNEVKKISQIKITSVTERILSQNSGSNAVPFEAFGQSMLAIDDNIWHLHLHQDGNIFSEFVAILPIQEEVIFVESLEHRSHTFILVAFATGKANLYLSRKLKDQTWEKIALIQIVSSGNHMLIAAKFVTIGIDIYMVAGYKHEFYGVVDSIIYLWSGSHFDEIRHIQTSEISNIAVILNDDHFIVAFAQNPQFEPNIGTLIYKYDPLNGLQKLSNLPSKAPSLVLSYKHNKSMFLMIVSGGKHIVHYKIEEFIINKLCNLTSTHGIDYHSQGEWSFPPKLETGSDVHVTWAELAPCSCRETATDGAVMEQARVEMEVDVTCGTVVDFNGVPLILVAGRNRLWIYDTHDRRLANITLSANVTITAVAVMKSHLGNLSIIAISNNRKLLVGVLIEILVEWQNIVLSRASQESDSVLQMLGRISQMLNERESIIEEMTRKVKHLTTLDNVLYDGTLRLGHPIKLRRSVVGEMNLITSYPMNNLEMPIIKSFQRNEYILADIENRMREVVVNGKPLKVENAIFEGDVTVTNFRARSLDAVTLNDLPFTAESLGSENQTLSSEKLDMVKILRVTNLTAPQYDRAIDEAFSESIFKSLKVDNLFIGDGRTINGIDPRDLLTKDFEGIVRGLKTFDTLSTVNLETVRLIGKNVTFRQVKNFSEKSDFHSIENITIDDLTVEDINGVNVNELLNKAFQRDFHYKIKGNLSIEAPLSVENLQVKTFCGTPVERMLTKSTAQNVSSILHVPNIMVKNAKIKRLNGLDFEKDVAIIGRPNFITTPVIMADLKVKGNLSLDCKNRKSIYCTMTVKEIPDGKVQIYEGPVEILGSLTVKSISFSPSAKLKLYDDDLQQNNRLWKNKKMETDKVTKDKDSKPHNLTSVVNKINTRNQNHSQAVTSEKIRNNGQFSSNAFRMIQHINMTIPALEKFSSDCSAENGCKLRVQTYRDGNFCGLPAVCFCPIQYEILVTNNGIGIAYISKENNIFIRSFDVSAGEFVRFITNTTSYNSVCRGSETAVAAERTWLSRRSSPARLEELPISLITGYVTDVKSVDVDGFTFVAVAQCYDSIADSHNLDVQIFRTNKQGNVEHLQGLQSYGAWSLDMISGPFGTFLAVANSFDSESAREYVYSAIYRLNANRHSFEAEIYLPTIDCNNVLLTEVQKSELHAMFAQGAGLPILIYSRNSRSPEFFRKQTLSQNFEVRAMATMKIGAKSQLFTATSDDKITIYRYNLEQAWVMQTSAYLTGVQGFIPYTIKPEKRNYLFIPSNAENSTVILELSSN